MYQKSGSGTSWPIGIGSDTLVLLEHMEYFSSLDSRGKNGGVCEIGFWGDGLDMQVEVGGSIGYVTFLE